MKPLILWHRADFDGVCSAAIAKKFVPDAELHGLDYGDPFPWQKVWPPPGELSEIQLLAGQILVSTGRYAVDGFEKRKVYLLDFSLPPEDMEKLAACCDLIWCDHHKSALDACAGLDIRGVRSTALAGCELTWEWFASLNGEGLLPLPEAVRLLGRYDVWGAENPDWARIEAFQFGMRSLRGAMDPVNPMWEERFLSESDDVNLFNIATTVERGLGILSYRDQEAKALCADGAHEELLVVPTDMSDFQAGVDPTGKNYRLVCLNTLQRGSWLFKSVWDPAKHDMMCVYGKLKDGRWRVSLYSTKPEVDCGAIAKSLGGGGHRGAAGFICETRPWEN